MQAFRIATTIDQERQLRLLDVPFQPGTAVDVIVLEQGEQIPAASSGTSARPNGAAPADEQRERIRLAEKQYRLANQYPKEYVILIGERIVHHSVDRQQAVQAYRRIEVDELSNRPVIVSPGKPPRKPPMVRGRALTGKLPRAR